MYIFSCFMVDHWCVFFIPFHVVVAVNALFHCICVQVNECMHFFAYLTEDEWSECVLLFSHGLHYVSVCIVLTDFNKKFFCIKCTHSFTWLHVCLFVCYTIADVVLLGCFDSSHHGRLTLSISTFVDMSRSHTLPLPFNLTTDFLDS